MNAIRTVIRNLPESLWDAAVWEPRGNYLTGTIDVADRKRIATAIAAEVWDRAFAAGKSRAMRHMSDEPALPLAVPNPYREEATA